MPSGVAPRVLCELYTRELAQPISLSKKQISVLRLLLEDQGMGKVWESLRAERRDQKGLRDGKFDRRGSQFAIGREERFAYTVFEALRGPQGEEKLSRQKQYDRLDKVVETATKLSTLVKDTQWDVCWADRSGRKFSDFLLQFAGTAPTQMRLSILGKPNNSRATRTYFERRLHDYFLQEFGAPKHRLLAIVVSVLFPEKSVDVDVDNRIRQLKQSAEALKDLQIGDKRESARKLETADILDHLLTDKKKRKS